MFTNQAVALPRKQRSSSRRLIAVDIENIVGGAVLDMATAADAWRLIEVAIAIREGDIVIVGASHISAIAAWRCRPNARVVVRSGVDGADLALLEVLKGESIDTRFGEVVIVSGDGIFTDVAAELGAAGVHVTVVSRPARLARRLRMAAATLVIVPDFDLTLGGAA